MILETLELTDFRVFSGKHSIDLNPRTKYNKKRPVILFGGLNGAGKTSILTAIRLVLHGKASLGYGISKSQYDNFLAACVHRSSDLLLQSISSDLSLTFSYATMGVLKQYTVRRQWMLKGKSMVESLSLREGNKELTELSSEQCQGFLNELVPVGVADLFFFDGEKIAELAEDASGGILGDAIKKLLGLDLINTLHGDLTVYLRQKSKNSASLETQKVITGLESELNKLETEAKHELNAYELAKPMEAEAKGNIERLNRTLSSKGGAWARTRESEKVKQAQITAKIDLYEQQLRELISGSYPLAIASNSIHQLLEQLKAERSSKFRKDSSKAIQSHIENLEPLLKSVLSKSDFNNVAQLIEEEFSIALQDNPGFEIIHDVSDSVLSIIEASTIDAMTHQKDKVNDLAETLTSLREQLDRLGENIARAPEADTIQPVLDEIHQEQSRKDESIKRQTKHLERYKALLRQMLDLARKLEKETEKIQTESDDIRKVGYASATKSLLSEFSEEIAKAKVKELEQAFVESFSKLARKSDMALKAKINHKDFSVLLVSDDDREINKNELSAGEKQIYAISILEALAKTSGRNLPIIIDTPLGRLDSVHRTRLINEYFPVASHQVIIFSTDTEVDNTFYDSLSSSISHSYSLDYDPDANNTTLREGYFWKEKSLMEEGNHAA